MPKGLLAFARKIRHQPSCIRYHNYINWMAIWCPKELDVYIKKCKEAKQ